MIFEDDDQINDDNYDEDSHDSDQELTAFVTNRTNSKFQYPMRNNNSIQDNKPSSSLEINNAFQRQKSSQKPIPKSKLLLPRQFHMAKRALSKIVHEYFNELKAEYHRTTQILQKHQPQQNKKNQQTGTMYLNKGKIKSILTAIGQFVGINNKKYKTVLDLKFNYLQEQTKKIQFQARKGSFCYLPELQKIVNLNLKGKVEQIKIHSQTKCFKLPEYATPVPFKDMIYLLDPVRFDKKQKIYMPDVYSYKITQKSEILRLQKGPQHQRIKCALTRDQNSIYILGGIIGPNKITTVKCQKFNPKTGQFSQLPNLQTHHVCPSTCILKNQIGLFSSSGIQYLDKNLTLWTSVQKPWKCRLYPYQFVTAFSDTEILIFGGYSQSQKSTQLKIYDTKNNWMDVFDQVMPLQISNQRTFGPSFTDVGMAALSLILGQNQPDLKQKNNLVQITYLTANGVFLHNLHTAK